MFLRLCYLCVYQIFIKCLLSCGTEYKALGVKVRVHVSFYLRGIFTLVGKMK